MSTVKSLKLLTVDMDTIGGGGLVVRLYSNQDLSLRVEALLFVRIPTQEKSNPPLALSMCRYKQDGGQPSVLQINV